MNDLSRPNGEASGPLQTQQSGTQMLAAHAQNPQSQDDDGFDLRFLWSVLRARWYWILAAGFLGLAIALAQSLTAVPLYRSTASLELSPPSVPILSGQGEELVVANNSDWTFLTTQYGLLRSRDLARRVVEDLNLATNSGGDAPATAPQDRIEGKAAELAGNLTVTPVPDSRLVNLAYSSPDPNEAARIVNAYAEAFLNSSLDRRYEATSNAREFLADRIETVREQLNESEQSLVQYARANNIILPGSTGGSEAEGGGVTSLTATSLSALNAALAQTQQRRITAEQRYRQAGSLTGTDSNVASLRAEKAALEAEYREKSTYLQDEFPEMLRLKTRIEALDDAIRREASTASGGLEAEYRAALAEEQALRQRVRELSGNMLDEQEDSVEYNVLQREVDTNRSLYQALLDRYNEIGVVEGVGTPQAAILDRGRVPSSPYTPDIPGNLLLGLIFGLGLGALAAIAYEFFTDTIKTPDDVREKLRQPLLGAIPKKGRKDQLADQLADPMSPISEAYGSLLTTMQFTTSQGFPRVLTVSSSRAAEGKSTTSLVLAKRLSSLGRRVLLIDADMRKPSFVIPESGHTGLSQFLTGHEDLSHHVLRTADHALYLMPSGPTPPNPSLLLNSREMRDMIDRLVSQFDHVILDGPPLLGFSDSQSLAQLSDGVMLVVESGKTRRLAALEALASLRSIGARILGVTLTKHTASSDEYSYSYRYYAKAQALPTPHELTPELFRDDSDADDETKR